MGEAKRGVNFLGAGHFDKLVERMPRLVTAVIKSTGGFFDEKKI